MTSADGELTARLFTYPTGVHGIELCNDLGSAIVLPFQGQQIWDCGMLGRRLTMDPLLTCRPVELNKQWSDIDT